MDRLKLLSLKGVQLSGPFINFPKDLIYLCWIGFHLRAIPSDLSMENLVALDLSDSYLEVFELPMVLFSLKILDLRNSQKLYDVRNISMMPSLVTLILLKCSNLVYVCETIESLERLALLDLTECKNLGNLSWLIKIMNRLKGGITSLFSRGSSQQPSFPMPNSLERLFLTDCNLELTDYFPLCFVDQSFLEYLNLASNLFEYLPKYNHLRNLRVLDLSWCKRLKCLLDLPSTLAELYIYNCESLEKVTFESHQFTLQKIGYEGCIILCEIEGLMKLVPVVEVDETDLGHMKWLKEYQNYDVHLVGDEELTKNRSPCVQVLHEFGIMSMSLPDMTIPNKQYISELPSLSFNVPLCPPNRKLKGLTVSFKYKTFGDDWVWFAKIRTTNGVDLIYNPIVFGNPVFGEVGTWLSYWPIGDRLQFGDNVKVSIVVMMGLEVCECCASLEYTDVEKADETLEDNIELVETLEGDLSAFQLISTRAHYLCRRDFFELLEIGKLTPGWVSNLVGDDIDDTEVQGWTKTGRRTKSESEPKTTRNPSYSISKPFGFSSSIKASPLANASSYDVFVSVISEDTHHSFTDHLYAELERSKIRYYRKKEGINKRGELTPEIRKAIKASKASIIVLSENYATSTSCLNELLFILEQKKVCNHFVLPVFYHVDPSDVRNQNKTFKIEEESSSSLTNDNINLWKTALTEVGNLTNIMVLSGSETIFLEDIVDTVDNKICPKYSHLPPNLIRMDTLDKEINSWLAELDATFLAICGMGGSGKTTLAKYIVNSNWHNFENTVILENIGTRREEPQDWLQLQQNLLRRGRNRRIPDVDDVMGNLEEVLQSKKTLIVLDDIVECTQLLAFLGNGNINKHSKIIITTRDNSIKVWPCFTSCRFREYEIKLLNDSDSLELLSLHAFNSKLPTIGYEELAKRAIKCCEGNPLAIKVLGSTLSTNNIIPSWDRVMNSEILDVLMRSYNSLLDDDEKELFLNIACFFNGEDKDIVVKVLEPDYSDVESGIDTLINKHLLSESKNKKLIMHRLHRDMGRIIVDKESDKPRKRSRVWRDKESFIVLRKGKGSKRIKGLALDVNKLSQETEFPFQSAELSTSAFKKMVNLKFLRLDFVKFTGSYENFSKHIRWLCWRKFHLRTIPSDLCMGNLVALDMRDSLLEVFEPPMDFVSLKILNLNSSQRLLKIRNIIRLPLLETLILSYCHRLVCVSKNLGDLKRLTLLNIIGCEELCKIEQTNLLKRLNDNYISLQQASFSLPSSLEKLYLSDFNLECIRYFSLSFSNQSFLQYLNLDRGRFKVMPTYNHLKNLRVLKFTFSLSLKCLLCLPSTLAELYIHYCTSLEKVTFESHKFTLQEFGYKGCINLSEVDGFIRLVPVAKLNLGHLNWLKEYQNYEMCLVGDDVLTIGRSFDVQILFEFDIMSTTLPETMDSQMTHEYISSGSESLCFYVPTCPNNTSIKGLNVSFKYKISGDNWVWFVKISTTSGADFMYNPTVFGKPGSGEVGIWLSYWPIGNTLNIADEVKISIIVISGLEVIECRASLVYTDDEAVNGTIENNTSCPSTLGGDLSKFRLSIGTYYLCRRDFYKLMEVGRLNPNWLRILVGNTIDYAEVRDWKMSGRPFTKFNQ